MFLADFHIHSRYSRATSKDCVPEMLDLWARRKGLGLIGTGDFTHPAWREELKEKLVPAEEGLYALKDEFRVEDRTAGVRANPRFLVTGEISSIYKKNGKVRKIHNLILLPSLESAEEVSRRLEAVGGNLHSDGRPILGLDSRDLLEITLNACPDAVFVPAHIWTPHFSLFGAYSGFDTIEECFGDLTGCIHALETGLSSDPPMNWRVSALDRFTLVSNSDAHSPANLAREANLFDTALSYPLVKRALENPGSGFCGTVEFFPEEGKYHYDGHRNCGVCLKPGDTEAAGGVCPVCGGRITVGVLHRVESLADRPEGFTPPSAAHFESLIPLREVIAASTGLSATGKKVRGRYDAMLRSLGPELFILREAAIDDVGRAAGPLVAEGIRRLRSGNVTVLPGYDGKYGKVKILDEQAIDALTGQLYFFSGDGAAGKRKVAAVEAAAPLEPKISSALQEDSGSAALAAEPAWQADTAADTAGLNPEQRAAVLACGRAVAVVAGPGTGKTRTLVSRIVHLVRECGVSPGRITAVTFTNRAADEMRSRLAAELGGGRTAKAVGIGTFHAVCLRLLTEKEGKAPSVLSGQDALSLVSDVLKELGLKASAQDTLNKISLVKSGARPDDGTEVPQEVLDRYRARLAQYGVLDYDDILLNALRLFEKVPPGGREEKKLRKGFSHLLVDEFQDINPVQYRLIRAWGKDSAGVFVIGDPDQSIYGFRGSDPRCFERFFTDFPGAEKIRLTRNYRSTPEILGCARTVLGRFCAEPPLDARRESGAKVRLLEADGDLPEAIFVAKEIDRMVGGIDMLTAHDSGKKGAAPEGTRSFSDIAVLVRTNRQAEMLEQCLQKEGIPYLAAGSGDFLADREVRRAVAFFRFLLDPSDLISLRFYLKEREILPADGIRRLLVDYAATERSVGSLLALVEGPSAPAGARKFFGLLRKYAPLAGGGKPQSLIGAWIADNGLEGERSMEQFAGMAVLHETMPSLLRNLLLGREGDVRRCGGKSYSPDAVSLMTLHAAKGLEFPAVFVCGVKEGCIPLKNRGGACDEDEERRLLYVGMTRARDELILLTSAARSPFLSGLPAGLFSEGCVLERKKEPECEQLSFF